MNLLPFRVLHVGGRGDIGSIAPLYSLGQNLELTVVEADPSAEPIRVPDSLSGRVRLLTACLAAEQGNRKFHVTCNHQASSLYRMNPRLTRWTYNGVPWEKEATLDHNIDVSTTTIDDLRTEMRLQALHFLSLDAQGAEHDILRGAQETICSDSPVGVMTETALVPIYEQQGLLGDLVTELARNSFIFQGFAYLQEWRPDPRVTQGPGVVTVGETLFLRDYHHFFELGGDDLLENSARLIACASAFGLYSYASEALTFLEEDYGNVWDNFLSFDTFPYLFQAVATIKSLREGG